MLPERGGEETTPVRYAEWQGSAKRRVPAVIVGGVGSGVAALGFALAISGLGTLLAPIVGARWGASIGNFGFIGAIFGAGYVGHRLMSRVNERRLSALRDLPDDQFAMSIRLQREVTYAFDEGLVSLADGWLLYSGRNCSFSLRNCDVTSVFTWDKYVQLRYRGPHHAQKIEFRGDDWKGFEQALKEWKSGPVAEGEPIFPPITPDSTAFLLSRLSMAAGAVLLAAAIVTFANPTANRWAVGFIAACAAAALLIHGEGVRRALVRIRAGLPFQSNALLGLRSDTLTAHEEPTWTEPPLRPK